MKTPYYSGAFTAAQHTNVQDDDELRERMLEHRLTNRDDVREIYIVTAIPNDRVKALPGGKEIINKASERSRTDLSWAMHWALQIGDQFFELQRGYPDPLRTGLRMSKWDQQKQSQIHQRYRQGVTAMTDDEIKTVGERYFSRLDRIDINVYSLWCNNCQIAIDRMLRDIGGLFYYRRKLQSLHEWVKQSFYNAIVGITKMFGSLRGWNEEIIDKYSKVLYKTLRVMTSRTEYPKRHWIRSDIEAADSSLKKISTARDHWVLTVLEASLSLRKGSEDLYVRRGIDGKPELNFDALRDATKGIFGDDANPYFGWLKAVPWLTAGFLVGTPRWAAAVISIAISRASQLYEERVGLRGGLEESLTSLGFSPDPQSIHTGSLTTPSLRNQRKLTNGQKRVRTKTIPVDKRLVARYERCLTNAGVPYFIDHLNKSRSWDAPDEQEMCLKITDPPLSKKWEVKQEEGRTFYVNRITGQETESRPGATEIWAIKKRVTPDWIKSTVMALPCGWEMCRTEEGEKFYLNHNEDPPTSTTDHPMRQEIEDERRRLLPEWNVEWDHDRGKKFQNIGNGEIRWKEVNGPQHVPGGDKAKITLQQPQDVFNEPLPPGWTVTEDDGQKIYKNGKIGKERIERLSHPLTDKRRRLQPEWEMRYTPGKWRYWVHYGSDGRGTTWWTRNRLLKNTSLKNNANGWKLKKNSQEWEWFEGGDVPHSEIPVLDLDDPAEIEFREYPFVLPPQIETEDGTFVEPLPPNWVRRSQEDGIVYYWNFKDKIRSDQHPNEEERRSLPALWEMRFTRHGRLYFIHHEDSSTWWTHPREDKHEQKIRARPGQSQDGWKLTTTEDGKIWERFADCSDAESTEQSMTVLSQTQSTESGTLQNEPNAESWRSLSFTRDWLKNVSSSDMIANARTRIPKTPNMFKKFERSLSSNSNLVESPQEDSGEENVTETKWLDDTPAIVEEPQGDEESLPGLSPPAEETKMTWTTIRDPMMKRFRKTAKSPSITSSPKDSPQNQKEREPSDEASKLTDTKPTTEEAPSDKGESLTSPSHKQVIKGWAKRTSSGFLALKAARGNKSSGGASALPAGRDILDNDRNPKPAVDGLGITNAELESPEEQDVFLGSESMEENINSNNVLEKAER